MAETLLPDVMFIDINLPGMNGDELLPILKRSVALQKKGTVFYALTANAMMLDVERGKRVGFDDYLTKPINIKEIIAILAGSR
ncbi:response regulator [Thiomicrorhabdus chilensis]|uniref:response regulator n=1 Tax=Thiomicrorhabdus chilensis TaxID=63656 RepID=UPI000426E014|nr:response regulator [Thiomicrorhabdus chilensis]